MEGIRSTRQGHTLSKRKKKKSHPNLSAAHSERRCLKRELATQNSQGSRRCQRLHVPQGQTLGFRSRTLNRVNVNQITLNNTVMTDLCFSQGSQVALHSKFMAAFIFAVALTFHSLKCFLLQVGATFERDILVLVSVLFNTVW